MCCHIASVPNSHQVGWSPVLLGSNKFVLRHIPLLSREKPRFENVASVTLNPYFYTSALNSGKLENFRIENVEKLTLVSENCFENFPRSKNIHIANVDIKVRFTDTSRDWGMFEPHYFNYSKSPAEVSSWRGTTLEFKTASWITSDELDYLWRPQISCS